MLGVEEPESDIRPTETFDAAGHAQAEAILRFVQGVGVDAHERFGRFPKRPIVDIHGSNHYLSLQHPREVPAAMRTFRAAESLPPRPDER